jgi:uncharacterized protein YndB with AHSA1/START domain
MTALKSPRAVADVTQGMLLAMVEIAAPPERVFRALTTGELAQWWGSPETYRVTSHVNEGRKGGRWHSEGIGSAGQPFRVDGEILEWNPPHGFSQTWRYDWDEVGRTPTRIDWRIEAIEGGARVTLRHSGFAGAEACLDHANGWERVLGWAAAHLQQAVAA